MITPPQGCDQQNPERGKTPQDKRQFLQQVNGKTKKGGETKIERDLRDLSSKCSV